MPEGFFPTSQLVRHTKEVLLSRDPKQDVIDARYIREHIAPLYPETEFIGKGTEYIVVGHPDDNEKVVAYKYSNSFGHPLHSLEIYHFHRFFNALFPHNFPQFYASIGGEEPRTVRERIRAGSNVAIVFPFHEVKKTCTYLNIPLSVDDSEGNFIIGSDGGQYFIDTVMNINSSLFWKHFQANQLHSYMEIYGFTESRKTTIWNSLRRLRELEVLFAGQCYIDEPDKIPLQWQSDHQVFWQELCRNVGFGTSTHEDIASRNRILHTIKVFETYDAEHRDSIGKNQT